MVSPIFHLSKWAKFSQRADVLAVYHSLNLAVVYLPSSSLEFLQSLGTHGCSKATLVERLSADSFELLHAEGLLVDHDDTSLLSAVRDGLLKSERLGMLYLLVTDGCNLACHYCFEETAVGPNKHLPTLMKPEVAASAIRYFSSLYSQYGNPEKRPLIHLYGGEPLLNKPAVKSAIFEVRRLVSDGLLPESTETTVVTNGTLIDDDICEHFRNNRVTVGLSLDGPGWLNDRHRVYKKDTSSVYSSARSAFEKLRNHGVIAGVSLTLTPDVVANFDAVLEFLLEDLRIEDGLSFNILHYTPTMRLESEYFESAARCIIKAFEVFRIRNIYEERMMRKAKAFINRSPLFSDCGATGSQIVIAPDGNVGVCQDFIKPKTYFGDSFLNGYDPIHSNLFGDWKHRSPLFFPECVDCEAIGICGGGCGASAELQLGSKWKVDTRICPHSRLTLEWMIWETYRRCTQ